MDMRFTIALVLPMILGLLGLKTIEKNITNNVLEIKKSGVYIFNLIFLLMPLVVYLEMYFEIYSGGTDTWMLFLDNLISVSVVEEGAKFLLVLLALTKAKDYLLTRGQYIVGSYYYTVISAMAFAIAENIVYFHIIGNDIFYIRAVTSLPMHFGTLLFITYYYNENKLLKGFLISVLLHAMYNTISSISFTFNEVLVFRGGLIMNGVFAFCILFTGVYLMFKQLRIIEMEEKL